MIHTVAKKQRERESRKEIGTEAEAKSTRPIPRGSRETIAETTRGKGRREMN